MGLRDKFIEEIERTKMVTIDNGLIGVKYHLGGSSKVGDKILMASYPDGRKRFTSIILNESQLKYVKSWKRKYRLIGTIIEKKNRKSKSKKL